MSKSKTVVIAANTAWYLANFRLRLAQALLEKGCVVVTAAPWDADAKRLEQAGIRFIPLPMDNAGTNPVRDLGLILRLARLLKQERPDVFLAYTVKPNVYGGIACRLTGVPSIHNVAGLGTVFLSDNWLTRMVRFLYRFGLRNADKVFFQNPDDFALFQAQGLVRAERADLLPGSGVDTSHFCPQPQAERVDGEPFRFLLSARLIRDKGIGEFVEAARRLKRDGANVVCQLVGFLGAKNRSAITREQIAAWEREGVVQYLGAVDDVRSVLAAADCVVLPSYREGTPRSLLEAASMARPIITTDAVGCRQTVDDGITGYLCRPRDADDLADRMRAMMALSAAERAAMGEKGRAKMVAEFDEQIVLDRYLAVIEDIAWKSRDLPGNPAVEER